MRVATPRDIRRLAFQALFLLDARGEVESEAIRAALTDMADEDPAEFTAKERETAFERALAAFRERRETDAMVRELAPTWPAHRQPAVDRALIRLAAHEMHADPGKAKVAVNEAVELAKRYSTDRSPAFVNAILDRVLKRVLRVPESEAEPAVPLEGPGENPGGTV